MYHFKWNKDGAVAQPSACTRHTDGNVHNFSSFSVLSITIANRKKLKYYSMSIVYEEIILDNANNY